MKLLCSVSGFDTVIVLIRKEVFSSHSHVRTSFDLGQCGSGWRLGRCLDGFLTLEATST